MFDPSHFTHVMFAAVTGDGAFSGREHAPAAAGRSLQHCIAGFAGNRLILEFNDFNGLEVRR